MRWPKCFVASCYSAVVVVAGGVATPVHAGLPPYYGLTWSDRGRMFVACQYVHGKGKLLEFNTAFSLVAEHPMPVDEVHNILWWNGALYVTAARDAVVYRWRFDAAPEVGYRSDATPAGTGWVNSIWATHDRFYIGEHRGAAEDKCSVVVVTDENFNRLRAYRTGASTHDVFARAGKIYFCDSSGTRGFCRIDAQSGEREKTVVALNEFPRGIATAPGGFVVGESEYTGRAHRAKGGGWVHLIPDDMHGVVATLELGFGAVHAIRTLTADPAHNGIAFGAC